MYIARGFSDRLILGMSAMYPGSGLVIENFSKETNQMIQKKLTQFGVASALLLLSCSALANWTVGVNYSQVSIEDVDLGAVVGSVGYRFQAADRFYLVPEVRAGFGVGDDTADFGGSFSARVEIDRLWGASNRFQYEFDTGAYLFGVVSYINYKFEASATGLSVSDDSWESGFGGGAGYMFSPLVGGELSYERVDGEDVFSIGLRFNF